MHTFLSSFKRRFISVKAFFKNILVNLSYIEFQLIIILNLREENTHRPIFNEFQICSIKTKVANFFYSVYSDNFTFKTYADPENFHRRRGVGRILIFSGKGEGDVPMTFLGVTFLCKLREFELCRRAPPFQICAYNIALHP